MKVNLTFLFCKLVEKTRLSHAHISNDDIFEDVFVWKRSHFELGCSAKGDRVEEEEKRTRKEEEGSLSNTQEKKLLFS